MTPFTLQPAPKGTRNDQDKLVPPAQTARWALQRLRGWLGASAVQVQACPSEIARPYSSWCSVPGLLATGKGMTPDQALASGLMELCERLSWLRFVANAQPGYRVVSFDDVVGQPTATVGGEYFLANFRPAARDAALEAEVRSLALPWLSAWSLTRAAPFLYPIGWHSLSMTTNGLAAGNCKEEALVQGLCEVIEREAVYRLFVLDRPGRTLDLGAVGDPLVAAAVEHLGHHGVELRALEIGGDLGVAVVVVRGRRQRDRGLATYCGVGQGAHPSPAQALRRALSEYLESFAKAERMQALSGMDFEAWSHALGRRHTGFHAHYNAAVMDRCTGSVTLADLPDHSAPDFAVEAERIVAGLAALGYETVVIDKTHPALHVPTLRVFVPGMRSIIANEADDPRYLLDAARSAALALRPTRTPSCGSDGGP